MPAAAPADVVCSTAVAAAGAQPEAAPAQAAAVAAAAAAVCLPASASWGGPCPERVLEAAAGPAEMLVGSAVTAGPSQHPARQCCPGQRAGGEQGSPDSPCKQTKLCDRELMWMLPSRHRGLSA